MVVCRMLDSCPPSQLTSLATALEPVLHLDFCSSLAPLKAALHHEGLEIFRVQRAINNSSLQHWNKEAESLKQTPHNPEKMMQYLSKSEQFTARSDREQAKDPLSNKPAKTVSSLPFLKSSIKEEAHHVCPPVFLPALEISHSKHKISPASSDYRHPSDTRQEGETFTLPPLALHRRYNSVPNFRNTSDLLQHSKQADSQDQHQRSKSFGVHMQDQIRRKRRKPKATSKVRHLELYKRQLGLVSQVSLSTASFSLSSLPHPPSLCLMSVSLFLHVVDVAVQHGRESPPRA